jgi:hypothetical protein
MNLLKTTLLGAMAAASLAPLGAHAALILDTGTPDGSGQPTALNGAQFEAAEFALGAGQTITSILAYVTAPSDQPGATFTIALYDDASGFIGARSPDLVFSGQATYQQDGWTGLTNLDITGLPAGNYWAALEVGSGDSAIGLALPAPVTPGTAPALGYAFSDGSGYTANGALPIGMQVEVAPVPIPGALLLFASGLLGLGGISRRRS